jgi:hypothetical protein
VVFVYRSRKAENPVAGFAKEEFMNNRELNDLLRAAKLPEPPEDYWDQFPGDLTRIARSSQSSARVTRAPGLLERRSRWREAVGLAAACITAAFVIGYNAGNRSHPDQPIASIEKCLREVQALFPNQVRAIIFEKGGAHLLLSDAPDVPGAMPVYLKVCDGNVCQRIVTFSGQRLSINGELCDVLVDSRQNVLVVGQRKFWPGGMPSNTRVEASTL